jgi:hypothetical protein
VIALKLTCPTNPGENTIVRGSAPVSQGREVCKDFRILGTCPPRGGFGRHHSLYTARYGVPPVGKKVYVQVNQFVDGWESLPRTFWAIVPAQRVGDDLRHHAVSLIPAASAPKQIKASVTGSGTAVMSRLQLTSPFSIPLVLLSHSTKAHVSFGSKPLKPAPGVPEAPEKVTS